MFPEGLHRSMRLFSGIPNNLANYSFVLGLDFKLVALIDLNNLSTSAKKMYCSFWFLLVISVGKTLLFNFIKMSEKSLPCLLHSCSQRNYFSEFVGLEGFLKASALAGQCF